MLENKLSPSSEILAPHKAVYLDWPPEALQFVLSTVNSDAFKYEPSSNFTGWEGGAPFAFEKRQLFYYYQPTSWASRQDLELIDCIKNAGVVDAMKMACGWQDPLKFLQVNRQSEGNFIGSHIHSEDDFSYFASIEIAPSSSGGRLYIQDRLGERDRRYLESGPHIMNICHSHQPHGVTKVESGSTPRISIVIGI